MRAARDMSTRCLTIKGLASRRADLDKTKGQPAFPQPDLMYRFELNCSWWAKGDLNPHVPKDTGT